MISSIDLIIGFSPVSILYLTISCYHSLLEMIQNCFHIKDDFRVNRKIYILFLEFIVVFNIQVALSKILFSVFI